MVYKAVEEDQMDILEDLLPGIEDYLSTVLANESLSSEAEEQRQYFLERLDIIKLPPTVPPRPQNFDVKLFPAQEVHVATIHTIPHHERVPSMDDDAFAAYQREISRQAASHSSSHENSPEHQQEEVKVYDDIDLDQMDVKSDISSKHEEIEESMYEIPQVKRSLSESGYEKAKEIIPTIIQAPSIEELDGPPPPPPTTLPPPLPPRRDRSWSDANSRDSIGSLLETHSVDTDGGKPNFNREFSYASQPDRGDNSSMKSDDPLDYLTDDLDVGCSNDSLDESYEGHNVEMMKKLGIKLPKPVKKKKRHRTLGISLSATLWEVRQPFHALEDVMLSGELHYRSRLTWTRKVAAVTNGRLVCYKCDKIDSRPSLVVLLNGYTATFQKKDRKRHVEIRLTHENLESYLFLVEFKEWAETWCEHLNAAAQGKKPTGPPQHLARGTTIELTGDRNYSLGKASLKSSHSNLSTASSDGLDAEPGTVKVKKRDSTGIKTQRMGSFAFKATQFFENLGKKSIKKPNSLSDSMRPRCKSVDSLSPTKSTFSEPTSPMTPESGTSYTLQSPLEEPERHVQHEGYLEIYSSFNKRKCGKRWCLIQDNTFECYQTKSSVAVELEIILKNCVLRRAIEETKSELGLMLLENEREKITIEPLSWGELGPWLRVLMKETSTPGTLEGLEAYLVEEISPYHAIVESPLSDPFPESPLEVKSLSCNTKPCGNNSDEDKLNTVGTSYSRKNNRDSGNCSGETESLESSKTESLERRRSENSSSKPTHQSYTDSSLHRVKVSEEGDLYTQIRRPSASSAGVASPNNQTTQKSNSNTNKKRISEEISEDQSRSHSTSCSPTSSPVVGSGDKLEFDFTNPHVQEESMMDAIFSQFTSQLSGEFTLTDPNHHGNRENLQNTFTESLHNSIEDKSSDYNVADANTNCTDTDTVVGIPVRNTTGTPSDQDDKSDSSNPFCDSNQVPDIQIQTSAPSDSADSGNGEVEDKVKTTMFDVNDNEQMEDLSAQLRPKDQRSVSENSERQSSLILRDLAESDVPLQEKLEEMRRKLVQLKRDRICTRDRKQQTSSQSDKDFLEAEFERLNRECTKVTDEIECLELFSRRREERLSRDRSESERSQTNGDT